MSNAPIQCYFSLKDTVVPACPCDASVPSNKPSKQVLCWFARNMKLVQIASAVLATGVALAAVFSVSRRFRVKSAV
jgi:hypothetical protein